MLSFALIHLLFKQCTSDFIVPKDNSVIQPNAYKRRTYLTGNLIITSRIVEIGSHSFDGCTKLAGSLKIPTSVKIIGDNAFRGCTVFSGKLTIFESLKSVGEQAFGACDGLKTVRFVGFKDPNYPKTAFPDLH